MCKRKAVGGGGGGGGVVIVHTKTTSSQLLGILVSGQHCHNVENGNDESLLQNS